MSDYQLEDTVFLPFTTRAFATGVPTVLTGSPAIDIYEDATVTPIVTGETLAVDLNSVVGFNMITVTATAAQGFNTGGFYTAIIQAGTIGGVSVVGEVVATFSLETVTQSVWDRVLTGATHNITNSAGRRLRTLQESGGVYGGQIYIDTLNGTAGTVDYENGTSDNHVLTLADAKTLSTSIKIPDFHVINGSTITLAENTDNESYFGDNWNLVLENQSCAGAHFEGAEFSGIQTGSNCGFFGGEAGDITIADDAHLVNVGLGGTITLPAGAVELINCHHDGATAPVLDFGAAIGSTTVHCHNYSGAIEVQNIGDSGTDIMHLDGNGTLTVNANSSGGTIHIRGLWKVDNLLGLVTVTNDDLNSGIIYGDAETGTLSTTQCTSSLTGYTGNQLIGRVIIFLEGPADGEATDITDYASVNGLLTFTALTLAPENGNAFKIV